MKKRVNNIKIIFITIIILLICMASISFSRNNITGQVTWRGSFNKLNPVSWFRRVTPTEKPIAIKDTGLDKTIPTDPIQIKKEVNCNAAKNKIINYVAGVAYKDYKDGIKVYQYPELLEKYNVVESYHVTPFKILEEPTCFFVVDLMPYAMFAHPVEYIYVNPETLKQEKDYAMWWPKVNGISWPLPDENKIYEKEIVVKTPSTQPQVQQPSRFVRFFRIFSPFGRTVLDVTGLIPIGPSQLTPLKAPQELEVKEIKTTEHKVPKLTDNSECYECPNKFTCEGDKYALIVNGISKDQSGYKESLKGVEFAYKELSKIVPRENLIRIGPNLVTKGGIIQVGLVENIRQKLMGELNDLKFKLKPNDKLFIYITAHGMAGITGDTLIMEKEHLEEEVKGVEEASKDPSLSQKTRTLLNELLDEKKEELRKTKEQIELIKKFFGETYHRVSLGNKQLYSLELSRFLETFDKDVSITVLLSSCFGGAAVDHFKDVESVKQIIISANRYWVGWGSYDKEFFNDVGKLAPLYKDKKINWFDLWSFATYSARENIFGYSILSTYPASPTVYDKNCEFNFEYDYMFSSKQNLFGKLKEIEEMVKLIKHHGFDINSLMVQNTGAHNINDVIVCYNGKILNKIEEQTLAGTVWNMLKISDKCIKFYSDVDAIVPGGSKEFIFEKIKLTTTMRNVKIPYINKEKFVESDDQAKPARVVRVCISWDEGKEHKELCKCPNRGSFRFYESLKEKKSNPKICEAVIGVVKPIEIEKVSLPEETATSAEYYIPPEEQCKVTKEYCNGKNGKFKNRCYPSNYGNPIKITRYSCDENKNCVLKKAFEDCKTIVGGKIDYGRCVPTADGAICLYDGEADKIWGAAAQEGDTSQF